MGSSLATIAWTANVACAPEGKRHAAGKTAGTRAGIAGARPELWNGPAAATQVDATAIAPIRISFRFTPYLRMVRRSILSLCSHSVSYRVTERRPKPILSDTRSEGMLFVLLTPFELPFPSWIAKV